MLTHFANHLSVKYREQVKDAAWANSRVYSTPKQGRINRFYASVEQTRFHAQNNAVCRGLDGAFCRVTAKGPRVDAASPWRDGAVLAACAGAFVVRQMVDALACLVGAVLGAIRFSQPIAPWRGPMLTNLPHEDLCANLQQALSVYNPEFTVDRPHVPTSGKPWSVCELFVRDAHRSNITLCDRDGKEHHWTPKQQYSSAYYCQRVENLCGGHLPWTMHVSRALTQMVGGSVVHSLYNNPALRVFDKPVALWAGTGHEQQTVARWIDDATIEVNTTLVHEIARLEFRDGTHEACSGTVYYNVTLQVPRPPSAHTPPQMLLTQFKIAADDIVGLSLD